MAKDKESKMIACKQCGAEIAKSAKTCPHCGAKNKKPIYKRAWFIILVILIVLGAIGIAGSGNQYKQSEDTQTMSKKDYKEACQEISYKELLRDPDKYLGEKVKFTGEVRQVVYEAEDGESEYMIAVTKDEYDFYDDNVYFYYNHGDNPKLIEEDIVTLWGEASGTKTYTTVLGASVTIPAVTVAYAEIK